MCSSDLLLHDALGAVDGFLRRLDDDVDREDARVLAGPQFLQTIQIIGHDPIAHETAGHRETHLAAGLVADRDGLDPIVEGGFPDFRLEPTANSIPLRLKLAFVATRLHTTVGPAIRRVERIAATHALRAESAETAL